MKIAQVDKNTFEVVAVWKFADDFDPTSSAAQKYTHPDFYYVLVTEQTGVSAKGYTYRADLGKFIEPAPYESWVLNENNVWTAPVSEPQDGQFYDWNEENQTWDLVVFEEVTEDEDSIL